LYLGGGGIGPIFSFLSSSACGLFRGETPSSVAAVQPPSLMPRLCLMTRASMASSWRCRS
jgi:hypothetical protein